MMKGIHPRWRRRGNGKGQATRVRLWLRQFGASGLGTCPYCLKGVKYGDAVIDHIVSGVYGGKDDDPNMVMVCEPCNQTKRHKTLLAFLGPRSYVRFVLEHEWCELSIAPEQDVEYKYWKHNPSYHAQKSISLSLSQA